MIASVSGKFPWKELMTRVTRPFLSDTLDKKKDKAHDSGRVSFSLFTNLAFFCSFAPMGLENQRIEYDTKNKGKEPQLVSPLVSAPSGGALSEGSSLPSLY